MNEAAQLVTAITGKGYSRAFIARALGTNSSYVSQFFTKNKGASKVNALRAMLDTISGAGQGEKLSQEAARATAAPVNPQRDAAKRTRGGWRSKGGQKAFQRAARTASANGAPAVGQLVRDAAALGQRMYITVSVPKGTTVQGKYDPTPDKWAHGKGGRRYKQERELEYGNGGRGYPASDFANLMDQYGSITEAVSQWLMVSGKTSTAPKIYRIEVRVSS